MRLKRCEERLNEITKDFAQLLTCARHIMRGEEVRCRGKIIIISEKMYSFLEEIDIITEVLRGKFAIGKWDTRRIQLISKYLNLQDRVTSIEKVLGICLSRLKEFKPIAKLAKEIAIKAHEGQTRRDGTTPYITHPSAVAGRVSGSDAKAVAWLHDVLEDTDETVESLREKGISESVIKAVYALTKTKGDSYDNYLNIVMSNDLAREVKIQDMMHNLEDNPTDRQVKKYTLGLTTLYSHHLY